MSLKLNERYPARFNNPTAGYPQGSFKNRTTPTSKDGSYLEKDWANDKEGFFQSLLSAAGITANGAVDAVGASQFFDALQVLKQLQSGTAFTTAGSAGALTLTPTPSISAYSVPLRFRVKFSQSSAGASTINISGQGAKSLKQYDSAGSKVAAVFVANQLADIEYDGTDFVLMNKLSATPQTSASDTTAGRAMIVSAFGLGGDPVALAPGDDLNSARVTGYYYASGSTNSPSGSGNGFMAQQSLGDGSSYATQVFKNLSNIRWERTRNAGTWGPWSRIYGSSDYVLQKGRSTGANTGTITFPVAYTTSDPTTISVIATAENTQSGAETVEVSNVTTGGFTYVIGSAGTAFRWISMGV